LVKLSGQAEALRGIDLDIEPGETFGFLGPDGAGKSPKISLL
jgi:ABC-type multidrug transport system ATPase subunit